MQPNASMIVTWAIPVLSLAVLAAVAWLIARLAPNGRRDARNFALVAAAWLMTTALLARSGYYADFKTLPPPALTVALPMFAMSIGLARSRIGSALIQQTPLAWLIGLQGFRLPLELVMHQAAVEGVMPPQMTFASPGISGCNFDIVTGATAIVVAYLAHTGRAPRALLIAWNALGTLLLLTILTVAIVSLPLLHRFGSDAAHMNTWVAYFPFVWLPAVLVGAAVFGHVLLWRALLSQPDNLHARMAPSASGNGFAGGVPRAPT